MTLSKMQLSIILKFMNHLIFLIFYEIALWVIAFLAMPKLIYSIIFQKKYRESLFLRLGIQYPIFRPSKYRSIWIHAVSVGETKAVVSVARELKRLFPHHPLIISSITETAHAEAKRSLPFADYHVYLPFDFAFLVKAIVKKASPGLVILSESDFWYHFLYYAKQGGAAIAMVNGKISERSAWRFHQFSYFAKPLFRLFDVMCVQNKLYVERFIEAGATHDQLVVTGNLKLDEDYPQLSQDEIQQWKKKLGIRGDQLVLTIGSTHHPEEEMFLHILKEIWEKHPKLRVILVPRHPERFGQVAELLERAQISWINFSNIQRCTAQEKVILIDAMGLLRMCYQLSDCAIVAGSYTKRVGGHNIIEPCSYGTPVLFGPYMHSQVELVDLMKQYHAGRQVDIKDLPMVLTQWLENSHERLELGAGGFHLVHSLKGANQRTLQALQPILSAINHV